MPESDGEGPPWYSRDPDGRIQRAIVPERLLRHRGLQERGILPYYPIKPGVVFGTYDPDNDDAPQYVIKILDLSTQELPIYERLLRNLDCPANHTLPCEIIRSDHPVLVMPMLSSIDASCIALDGGTPLAPLFRAFHELVEGVEYLHALHIAHLDLCWGNVIMATPRMAAQHKGVVAWGIYIIDYDTSRQLTRRPRRHPAITLPDTQVEPPDGLTTFDPYSWDVYCLGRLLERTMEMYYRKQERPHWLARWFVTWLIGTERGCTKVCRCRPTAATARRVLDILGWIAPVFDTFSAKC
ncbi:hypothetical protein BV20DRAFT_943584 [Pilatotrama ljubarskyi]|nr:hypothetical protein BV20DRAFT_943584 [Pilatotrama ljubarskyi]